MTDTAEAAAALVEWLREQAAGVEFVPVGSLRRGCETCGDLDVLAIGAPAAVMEHFTTYRLVERVLGHGDTKSSVLLRGGQQADLRLVPAESRGAAMQYFTGSKAHNIALRDRAIGRGFKLNEYGLFRVSDGERVAGETEDGHLRGARPAVDCARTARAPRRVRGRGAGCAAALIERATCAATCTATRPPPTAGTPSRPWRSRRATPGLEYLAITDHSQALAMANGLDEQRALAHARAVRELSARLDGITLLAGIECDIRADGTLDLADDCLAQLDFVVASMHSAFGQDEQEMTDRLLRAMECPWVDVDRPPDRPHAPAARAAQGAPRSGDRRRRPAGRRARDQLPGRSARPHDVNARHARDRGVKLVIASDAHSTRALRDAGVGRHRRAPRVGDAGGRAEHPVRSRICGPRCGATAPRASAAPS